MIDIIIVGLFILYSLSVGFLNQKKASRDLEQYFLAGRTLKGWQAGLSMSATQYAADTPLLVAGLVATAGVFSLWRLWIYALAFLMMGFIFAQGWRRSHVLTDAEFTELRYGGKGAIMLRALKAIYLGTIVNCAVLAMVLLAATRIAEPFLLWHEWFPQLGVESIAEWFKHHEIVLSSRPVDDPSVYLYSVNNSISILAIVIFTSLYSMTGGLRSVVATDVVQFIIMMVATIAYAVILLRHVGGFEALVTKMHSLYGEETATKLLSFGPPDFSQATNVFIIVLAVQWFAQVNSDGTGYLAQRSMACRSDQDAKNAALIFTFAQVVLRSLIWLPIAVALLVLFPAESISIGNASANFQSVRESYFAQGIKDFLPVGIRGLMLTGMLAALASTLDTHLNWGASYWTNDLYKRVIMEKWLKRSPQGQEQVWVARLSNIGILLIALFLMTKLSSIQNAWHMSLLFGSGLGVVLILRWLWFRINLKSEVTAILVSICLAPILLFVFPSMSEGSRLLWMVLISTLSVVGITLMTRPESEEILQNFYARVRPMGVWGALASEGENPLKTFKKASLRVVTCSLSVFLLLIGIGNLMLGGLSGVYTGLMIVIALALIPIWLKKDHEESERECVT